MNERDPNKIAIAAVVVLAIAAVVLNALALTRGGADDASAVDFATRAPSTSPSSSPSGLPTASPTESPTGSATAEPSEPVVPTTWSAGMVARALVVRASGDACVAGGPSIAVSASIDGGVIFRTTEVAGLTSVTGVDVHDRKSATLLGAGADCQPVGLETADSGNTWTATDELPTFWSLLAGTDTEVMTPGGPAAVPCPPAAISGVDGSVARLWCADGRVLGTATSGSEWVPLGTLAGGRSMIFTSPGDGYALVDREECDGVAVMRTRDGSSWKQVHCSTLPAPHGLAADGGTAILLGADGVEASTDAGETWTAR